MLWFVCLPACIPCGFCAFNQLFMADVPDHWCRIPQLNNLTLNERKLLGIPNLNGTYSRCERYVVDWDASFENKSEPDGSWPLEPCLDGWEYNTTEIISSIVIDVII